MATATSSLSDYYADNGYVVVRNLLPVEQIDALLDLYKGDILVSRDKFFRQNTSRYEPNELTPAGYVKQSFLDIHAYQRHPQFRERALAIFFHERIHEALAHITGSKTHNLMQSMLFDANTTTPPHQDWWYLDSVPNGHLIAGWFAMEDIHEKAGRFFVIPKSQQVVLHEAGLAHSDWLARVRRYYDENSERVSAPALNRGDVLFWNSRTIHGSLPTQDAGYSRKSLTAHYLPAQMTFGNLFTSKEWVTYESYNQHKYFANQPEYSTKSMLLSKIKTTLYDSPALLKLARKLQHKSISDFSNRDSR